MVTAKKADATVVIRLSLPQEYIKDFLREWDDLEQKLCENGGVESCVIELPEATKVIEVF